MDWAFKAHMINIFVLKMLHMTTCMCKGLLGFCSSPQLYGAIKCLSGHCLAARTATLLFYFSLTALISILFSNKRQLFTAKKKALKNSLHYLLSTKWQKYTVSD